MINKRHNYFEQNLNANLFGREILLYY